MSLQERYKKSVAQTSPYSMNLEIEGSRGSYIFGRIDHSSEGNREEEAFLDFVSGMAVSSLGHKNKWVMQAVREQIDTAFHTGVYGEHIHDSQVRLAEEVLSYFPTSRSQIFFTNSGTEANELALKMAMKYQNFYKPDYTSFVAIEGGFHGRTLGAMSLSSNKKYKQGIPNVLSVDYIDPEDMSSIDQIDWTKVGAVFLELVQGEAGARPLSKKWVDQLWKVTRESNTLVVVDEVQTGFGRTGPILAQNHYRQWADITTLGKAMGGGFPIGGVVADRDIFTELQTPSFSHVTTFGGHPVSCAAGLATIKQISKHQANVGDRHRQLVNFFESKKLKWTGLGLMLALHFEDNEIAAKFVEGCLSMGLILGYKLNNNVSVRISPPLNITEGEVQSAIETMDAVLEDLQGNKA